MGLARILRERGLSAACSANKKGSGIANRYEASAAANPLRFPSISTETQAEVGNSHTQSIYTSPGSGVTPQDTLGRSPIDSLIHPVGVGGRYSIAGATMMNLVDRIKNIGLGSVIGAVAPASSGDSGTATPSSARSGSICSLDEEDTRDYSGLNTIMTMNNKQGFLTRGQAATGVVPHSQRRGLVQDPSGYFCTRLTSPPSRPSNLPLSRIINKPSDALVLPKSQQQNDQAQRGGTSSSSTSLTSGGVLTSSASLPVASSVIAKKQPSSAAAQCSTGAASQDTTSVCKGPSTATNAGCDMATVSNISDSLLRHLGSTHMRTGAAAALTQSQHSASQSLSQPQQTKPKSGGQLL